MYGRRIYEARIESGLTLEKISEILGISYQAYRMIEKEQNKPKFETLIRIAEMFNLSIDYILGYSNEKRPLFKDK